MAFLPSHDVLALVSSQIHCDRPVNPAPELTVGSSWSAIIYSLEECPHAT
jgi:hypothetical protein